MGAGQKQFYRLAGGFACHEDLLVRTRAAEFLGLTGMMNPVPVLMKALEESEDGVEALLILNSVVLLMDGPGYAFDLSKLKLDPEIAGGSGGAEAPGYICCRESVSHKNHVLLRHDSI